MRALLLAAAMAASACFAQERPPSVSTQLGVTGEVQKPVSLSIEDARALSKRRGTAVAGGYSGLRLLDLLEEADIRRDQPRALRRTYVVAFATDGYQAVFSWGELYNSPIGKGVIVALDRDGQPLRDGEGRFALISAGDDKPGPRHVKWLTRIDVRRVPE